MTPENFYVSCKYKVETKFKKDIENLDDKLKVAKQIPSFAWYIFKGADNYSNFIFDMLCKYNYIDDIRNAVNKWLQYTDDILKNPTQNFKYQPFPYYISHLINDVYHKVCHTCTISPSTKLHRLTQYITFYEQTIEPCFELQKQITQRHKELKECFAKNPLPKGEHEIRWFAYSGADIVSCYEVLHTKKYKEAKQFIKKVMLKNKLKAKIFNLFF